MPLTKIAAIIGIILGGAILSYAARRFDMGGFELWLPFGIIIGYAMNPLWGFGIAAAILLISWALFPYGLHYIVTMLGSLALALFITRFFPVGAENFLINWMIVAAIYNAVSTLIFMFTGYDWFRAIKFFVLSMLMSWLVFVKFGWQLFQWISI